VYAGIVVDVPHVDTDRAFDYMVPKGLAPWIQIGSRVSVPFGNRVLQGYVVQLKEQTELAKVKEIKEILDITPPLTEELVALGHWLSTTYICRLYSAMQVMLPASLRSQYKKKVRATSEGLNHPFLLPGEREIFSYLGMHPEGLDLDQLVRKFPEQTAFLLKAEREGWVETSQFVKDKITRKTLLYVKKKVKDEQIPELVEQLSKQAERQKEVMQYLRDHEHPIALKDLLFELGISSSTVKSLVAKDWLELVEVEERRDPYANKKLEKDQKVEYTPEQQEVIFEIDTALNAGEHAGFLLHGVTGSGKTEVYLETISRCLAQGREAIVLVPEISLTPQMVNRFKARFGDRVAVMHSRLSQGERYDEWRMIRDGKVSVVVGARSAIFAPFTNLGLIIIDEEHESSYKQEETPRYHTRDVAMKRAEYHKGVVVLGSATPAMESYDLAQRGKIGLLTMLKRVGDRPLPSTLIVDMREELRDGNRTMFSRQLSQAIQDRLQRKEQIVIFLNRRGFSTFVMCRSCGHSLQCPHCDISLTYHRNNRTVRCHYCGYAEVEPNTCPSCESNHIRFFGTGTQKVEEELSKHFPGIRVIRMDIDTTTQKGSHEKLLQQFREQQGDVLLGTQMIAKGLDFPKVTLVGVIAADTILGMPDFRAAEKTFQLLTQVAGRGGRHQLPGETIIQTYNPEHYSIQYAKTHDYQGFFSMEAKHRFEKGYPPFSRLILFTFSSPQVPLAIKKANEWAKKLRQTLPSSVFILGPIASPIPRVKDRYRFQCVLKYRNEKEVLPIVKKLSDAFVSQHKKDEVELTVDVNPQVLM